MMMGELVSDEETGRTDRCVSCVLSSGVSE